MLRELIISVASGIIVALVLSLFGLGGRGRSGPSQSMRNYNYAAPRRRSFFGRIVRFVLAVAGGLAFAFFAAPFILGRRFGDYDGYSRFDRFDGYDGIASHVPMLILTVIGTVIVWGLLSALTRR
ncbi:MAG: hypothetical protein HC850_17085 [Rhodomicrobium sp.]|nr:hypothetical protein [Rhodomicrobium sp.]